MIHSEIDDHSLLDFVTYGNGLRRFIEEIWLPVGESSPYYVMYVMDEMSELDHTPVLTTAWQIPNK